MTTAKKSDEPTKAVADPIKKQEPATAPPKGAEPKAASVAPPIPPLAQAITTRKALDEALKTRIMEMLAQPGANMTRISEETGVSYGVVQGLKQRISPAAPSAARKVAPKPTNVEDVELMKMELEFLRKKVAFLESRL